MLVGFGFKVLPGFGLLGWQLGALMTHRSYPKSSKPYLQAPVAFGWTSRRARSQRNLGLEAEKMAGVGPSC